MDDTVVYLFIFSYEPILFPNLAKKTQYQQTYNFYGKNYFQRRRLFFKNIYTPGFLYPEHVSYLQDVVYNVSAPEPGHPDPEMKIDQLHTCFQGEIINISGRYKVY